MSFFDKVFGRSNGKQGEKKLNKLVAAMEGGDMEKRIAAAKELGELGEPAIPTLVNVLTRGASWRELHPSVKKSLESIGEPAVEQLISALANSNAGLSAQDILANIGEPAVEPLIEALKSNDENTLFHAARVLGRIGDTRAIEPLIELDKNTPSYRVRNATGMALGHLGDPHAIPTLIELLNIQNWIGEVKNLLIKFGPAAVEPLIASLQEKCNANTYTSEIANHIIVLELIGDARAVDVLKALTAPGKDNQLKNLALKALSKLDVQAEISEDEIANLRDALLSNDYDVRKTALTQARLVTGSIEDTAFQRAFQASEKLQIAFDNQIKAVSSNEPMQACQDAIQLEPKFVAAYICLSYLHREYAKKPNDALTWAEKAIQIDPQNAVTWRERGMVYAALGDVPEAARAFHKVVSIEPQHTNLEPHARLVAVYERLRMQDHLNDALVQLDKAGMGLDPSHEREWERMVMATDKERLRKAILG